MQLAALTRAPLWLTLDCRCFRRCVIWLQPLWWWAAAAMLSAICSMSATPCRNGQPRSRRALGGEAIAISISLFVPLTLTALSVAVRRLARMEGRVVQADPKKGYFINYVGW